MDQYHICQQSKDAGIGPIQSFLCNVVYNASGTAIVQRRVVTAHRGTIHNTLPKYISTVAISSLKLPVRTHPGDDDRSKKKKGEISSPSATVQHWEKEPGGAGLKHRSEPE